MTNMCNFHTLATLIVNMIRSSVAITHSQLLQLTGNVIGSAGVEVPVGVNTVGSSSGSVGSLVAALGIVVEGFVEALLAGPRPMAVKLADLTDKGTKGPLRGGSTAAWRRRTAAGTEAMIGPLCRPSRKTTAPLLTQG